MSLNSPTYHHLITWESFFDPVFSQSPLFKACNVEVCHTHQYRNLSQCTWQIRAMLYILKPQWSLQKQSKKWVGVQTYTQMENWKARFEQQCQTQARLRCSCLCEWPREQLFHQVCGKRISHHPWITLEIKFVNTNVEGEEREFKRLNTQKVTWHVCLRGIVNA